jgi:hypothetical protein
MLRSSPPFGKPHFLRKFPNYLIINLDETPLPFEFLNGYSYDFKRVKTVADKSKRSSWNKRQTIITLYIMADVSTPFKPVCHGSSLDLTLDHVTIDIRMEGAILVHSEEAILMHSEETTNTLEKSHPSSTRPT